MNTDDLGGGGGGGGGVNTGDMSIDTTNSEEMMAGSHITELHTHNYEKSVTPELLIKVPNVS